MSFTQFKLDARLLQGISGADYVTPTPIQSAAIPVVLAGHDLIATAQTGTGKTAVFVIKGSTRTYTSSHHRTDQRTGRTDSRDDSGPWSKNAHS